MDLRAFAFGEEIYQEIEEFIIVDKTGWTVELVDKVARKIQTKDPIYQRLVPKVLWLQSAEAFTFPGKYIYVSRELLQYLTEEAMAFVFAHELGHHRLGHVSFGPDWTRKVPGGSALNLFLRMGNRLVSSAQNEMAADRWALDRCKAVGYDPIKCIELFRVLEKKALDMGDSFSVFGFLEEPTEETGVLGAVKQLVGRADRWVSEKRSGYKTIRERYETLSKLLR